MAEATTHPSPPEDERRNFLKKVLAVTAGLIVVLIPSAAGLIVLLDPLRRKTNKADFLPVTNLDALPDDDLPHPFQVVADRRDAWNLYPAQRIGAVYLRRNKDKVTAVNVVCPHLGCFVDATADGSFKCPCHNSTFQKDGSLIAGSVSPRGLDELEVDQQSLKSGIVKVRFQNFQAGTHLRIPV
ncbi:MAG TPA: Rieske 2Fe-2S domain-containing protein [Tepidisphaeraceae bacterium]|jgi:Rieske Fe-S protein|nr:Rieske 2Fe-2S domain-containing protein [Tepidisphaeraceae bacterium]